MKNFIKLFLLFSIIFATSFIEINIDNTEAREIKFNNEVNISTTTPPPSYDLRDYIDIGVENQYSFGICYAFASLTSIETYLALNYGEYYDFSELHFATSLYLKDNYYSSIDETLASGGNFGHFILYTQKDNSLILEKEMPMSTYKSLSSSTRATKLINDFNIINNNFYSIAKVNDTKSFPQYVGNKAQYTSTELESFRNDVKNHIMQYGSVTAGIYTNSSFNNSTINYKITNDSLVTDQKTINDNINHLISIVGWDDNYDANGTWTNKGAYICLNSWGTSFGNNGYFYVSYDDYFIESVIQGVSNATLSTTNNKISSIINHQDQTSIFTHVFSGEPTIYTANIFDTTNYIGENITYIDTFIKGGTTKFYIKFFNSHASALEGINTASTLISSSKVDDFSMYTKYKLSSPLNVSGNYMLVVREIDDTIRTYSLGGNSSDNLNIEPSYYNGSGINYFNINEDRWNPDVDGRKLDCTLPLILHTDKKYIQVSPFESSVDAITNEKYIKNNATFQNKQLQLTLTNSTITLSDLNNISIVKLLTKSVNVTSEFEFNLNDSIITITMIGSLSGSFTTGDYLIAIPCGDTIIYRIIEIQDVVTYKITYYLDGGTADNPNIYTNKQTSINLNIPVKNGYTFIDWFTDSGFTKTFNPNTLPYTNLTLYAKYDLATPTITYKSSNISITYYDGINIEISITATHYFLNEFNTLSYQWYKRTSLTDEFVIVDGATSPSLSLNTVAQSGYYACAVSITFNDPDLVSITTLKTLLPSQNNAILVNIKPYIYDMSNVKWNYTEAISYDTKIHTIELLNLPNGVTVNYLNNSQSDIGTYLAHATLIYDNMNGNAIANPVEDLNWEIRKAKITIIIDNITSTEELSNETLNFMYSCQIEHEYIPENISTLQDKINYLNLVYKLQSTANPYRNIITATTNIFDIYNITIVNGEYRVVIYNLSDNNITTTNEKGFVKNCVFTTQSYQTNETTNNLLKENNLTLINGYTISYSFLNNEEAAVTIPVEHKLLINNLAVYMLKNGKLTKLNSTISQNGLTFTTNEQNATYLIVKEDYSKTSNNEMFVLIGIISIYIALCVCAIISCIKHKHDF